MSQRLNHNAASPAGMKALGAVHGYVRQSGLPSRLVDLVFLRVSQINGCAYCIDMHSRDLLEAGLPVEHLVLAAVWPEAGSIFTEPEKAALAWAEDVTRRADQAGHACQCCARRRTASVLTGSQAVARRAERRVRGSAGPLTPASLPCSCEWAASSQAE